MKKIFFLSAILLCCVAANLQAQCSKGAKCVSKAECTKTTSDGSAAANPHSQVLTTSASKVNVSSHAIGKTGGVDGDAPKHDQSSVQAQKISVSKSVAASSKRDIDGAVVTAKDNLLNK